MCAESNHHLQPGQFEAAQAKYDELRWRLGFLRTKAAEPEPEPTNDQILDWYKLLPARPNPLSYTGQVDGVKTLNQHFSHLFPDQTTQFGQAFLEVGQRDGLGSVQAIPLCINHDFFASSLSDPGLGLEVVYFEPSMEFYYAEPFLNIYKPVSGEKLQGLFRALLLRSSNLLKTTNAKLNIWAEFRSDKNARTVVSRAKSILAAGCDFFSATSPHQRVKGIELHERVARRFVDELLTSEPGQILRLQQAYTTFLEMLKDRSLAPVDKRQFKAIVVPLVRDQFQIALRNDLPALKGEGLRGWKGIKIQSVPVLN